MRSLNRPPGYKRLITPREDARRQASASETLKKSENQAYVLEALWGVRTNVARGMERKLLATSSTILRQYSYSYSGQSTQALLVVYLSIDLSIYDMYTYILIYEYTYIQTYIHTYVYTYILIYIYIYILYVYI
jgi:hypothetical protein